MSFELFVGAFKHEERFRFPLTQLRSRFSANIESEDEFGFWKLRFTEGPCATELKPSKGTQITGFTVLRPPAYLEFWEVIAGVLEDLPCVLYWPGGGAVMASLDLLPHLPGDMIEELGIPWVTTNPEKIRQYVGDS